MNLKKLNSRDIIAYVIGGLSILFTLYVIIVVEKGYYHSDCTDSLMWANASYESGKLLDPDFYYAGFMPISGNVIMWPLIAIFGFGMKAQIIGLVIMFLLLTASVIWLCRKLGFQMYITLYAISLVLILLSSSEKLREIFWGHIIYYSFGSLMFVAALAAALKMYHSFEKKDSLKPLIIWVAILFGLSFICGINGFQIASLSAIPVAAAFVTYMFFEFGKKMSLKENKSIYLTLAVMALGMIIGLMVLKYLTDGMFARYANAYSKFSDPDTWGTHIVELPKSLFSLMGVTIDTTGPMFNLKGIVNLSIIIGTIILFVTPIKMLFDYKKIEKPEHKIMLLAHHFLEIVILTGWVFGMLNTANWRLSPLIVSAAICCMMYISNGLAGKEHKRRVLVVVLPLLLLMIIIPRSIYLMDKETEQNKSLERLISFMEKNDFTYGYSSFWRANLMTMMSDSKIVIRDVGLDTGVPVKSDYQTNKKWYDDVPGRTQYVLVMSADEYSKFEQSNGTTTIPQAGGTTTYSQAGDSTNTYSQESGSTTTTAIPQGGDSRSATDYKTPQRIEEFEGFKILVYDHNIF